MAIVPSPCFVVVSLISLSSRCPVHRSAGLDLVPGVEIPRLTYMAVAVAAGNGAAVADCRTRDQKDGSRGIFERTTENAGLVGFRTTGRRKVGSGAARRQPSAGAAKRLETALGLPRGSASRLRTALGGSDFGWPGTPGP